MSSIRWSLLLWFGLLAACAAATVSPDTAPRMAAEELRSRLDDPQLAVIDVRHPDHWESSSEKIPGASREDASRVRSWAEEYSPSQTIVLYCA